MKKYLLLLITIISYGAYAQAPDGAADYFISSADGDWNNPAIWIADDEVDVVSEGADNIPDGDDIVIINGHNITVTADAGYGKLVVTNSSADGTAHWLQINAGVSLTGYTTEEDGSVIVRTTAGGSLDKTQILVDGTLTCSNATISNTVIDVRSSLELQNGGTLNTGNLTFSSVDGSSKCQLKAYSGTGNIINITGNFINTSGNGRIKLGTDATKSTINFNGTSVQTIPIVGSSTDYSNITVANTAGATLEGGLLANNFYGDLVVDAGGVFNDGGFANVMLGDITISGTYNGSGSVDLAGTFKINSGGSFISTGCNINLEGYWTNGGTYTYSSGDNVTFDGTVLSVIGGSTDWYEVTCNNSAGTRFNIGAHKIHGILDIEDGPVTVGAFGASVTLVSDASGTAQMDDIGTGSYSGKITVQRYINKSSQSFTSISSPVTGTSLATWQANGIVFSGFTGSDYPSFGWNNCHWYDEPNHGTTKAGGWAFADNITNSVGSSNSYKAYYVYMDAVPFSLSVTGTPATGAVAVPLDYSNTAAADDNGWNLIGNPYPCTVDWDVLYAANSGDIEDIYIAYSGEYANYGYYWGNATSVPSGGVSSGGVTKDIPHSQGFWVKAISGGDGNLNFAESHKNTTDAGFLKSSNVDLFTINLTGNINTFQDQAMIYSEGRYSDLYEDIDVPKFYTMDPDNAPTLYTQSTDGANLALNIIGANSVSIPLGATAGTNVQGDYTLDFSIPVNFMEDGCLTLEDLHTGNTIDLRTTTSYTFTTSDTTTLPRFVIHMVRDISTDVTAPTCYGTNDGQVVLNGSGISGSSFELLDESGNSVFSGVASNDEVTITNVVAGTYEVSTDFVGSCSSNKLPITIEEPILVTADFILSQDTVYLDQGGIIEVSNLSSGTNFAWDFGDGNTSSGVNSTNVYTAPGVYQVMLTSDNDNIGSCTQVNSKNVIVMNGPLSIEELTLEENTNAFVNNGKVVVDFDLEDHIDAEIALVDVMGKVIMFKERNVYNSRITLISTDDLSSGVYFVNITIKGQRISQKLFID